MTNYQESMKNILLATIVLGLMSCTSQKKLETSNVPFETRQSTYQESLGGREESGTRAELKIVVAEQSDDMSFEKVYFRGRALDCKLISEEGTSALVSSYKSTKEIEAAMVKEGKKMKEAFDLQPDEAIIAFKKADGKLKYIKVEGVKEKAPILYKSKPRN